MGRTYPTFKWCRYADDGLVHCETEQQAQQMLAALDKRFKECGLELHPDKTKIVYCKDDNRRKRDYPKTEFDFLGYSYCQRSAKNTKTQKVFMSFTPAVSKSAQKSMRAKIREKKLYRRSELSLDDIANECNPVLRGWIEYYGKYHRTALNSVFQHFDNTLIAWAMRKYKTLRGHKTRAANFLRKICEREPTLFAHWNLGVTGSFA
jgi:RNA-directed DNA polymerase